MFSYSCNVSLIYYNYAYRIQIYNNINYCNYKITHAFAYTGTCMTLFISLSTLFLKQI